MKIFRGICLCPNSSSLIQFNSVAASFSGFGENHFYDDEKFLWVNPKKSFWHFSSFFLHFDRKCWKSHFSNFFRDWRDQKRSIKIFSRRQAYAETKRLRMSPYNNKLFWIFCNDDFTAFCHFCDRRERLKCFLANPIITPENKIT